MACDGAASLNNLKRQGMVFLRRAFSRSSRRLRGAWPRDPRLQSFVIIEKIDVEGNRRIEAETVRAYMTLGVGDIYSSQGADASLKRLYATGLFSDLSILQEGARIVVRVEENPIINIINFEGKLFY